MFGGAIMKKAMEKLADGCTSTAANSAARGKTFVIGTVQHDVHDIGKDITSMVLRGNGFNVIDLGVNVKPESFVAAIEEHSPQFVGMSVLLTTCYRSVTETMAAIQASGLRNKVRICIGGAAASALVAEKNGIDFYGETAVDGVNWAKSFG
jgi:5-methyltetrahydrofolate--homocysteine methyltransferase